MELREPHCILLPRAGLTVARATERRPHIVRDGGRAHAARRADRGPTDQRARSQQRERHAQRDAEVRLVRAKGDQPTGQGGEALHIGDTVTVIDGNFDPALPLSARVTELRSSSDPSREKVVLSNFKPIQTNLYKIVGQLQSLV